jgi:hypothetical protein
MTEYEAYQEHIRYTHDTYCRIVIRHASYDAARMLAARWKREISLEYLTEEKFVPLSTIDEYFQVPDYGETYPFSVRGKTIFLDSCSLAAVIMLVCSFKKLSRSSSVAIVFHCVVNSSFPRIICS